MSNEQDPGQNLPEEATQRRQGIKYLTPEESWQIKVELVKQVNRLKAENTELQAKCVALGRDLSIARRQRSQYFQAVKWLLANTNIDPSTVPGQIRHTLTHIVGRLIAKAQHTARKVING
ncbi:hypothetical protein V9K81_08740 [Pseudomonas monteilii]|uniref:hypothetical protein n=1 Tax=Pseudomonas monteilii TaxID=76759 RepID=UPI0030D47BE1